MEKPNEEKSMQIPAKAKHEVKVIASNDFKAFEKETNEFLETISDVRTLKGIVFSVNPKTGEYIHVINYTEVSPMTPEEWKEKQKRQAEFAKGFVPNDLMPNGEKVEKL